MRTRAECPLEAFPRQIYILSHPFSISTTFLGKTLETLAPLSYSNVTGLPAVRRPFVSFRGARPKDVVVDASRETVSAESCLALVTSRLAFLALRSDQGD